MTQILFHFDTTDNTSQQFRMGKACLNPSTNPAMTTQTCLYVINNTNVVPQTVYAGFAADARHRWQTRTEIFHDFGISHLYGKNVKCAWCYPRESKPGIANPDPNNLAHWDYVDDGDMAGSHNAEHLLVRCLIKGVMGVVTSTNTLLRNTQFDRRITWPALSRVYLYFGNKFNWPAGNARYVDVGNTYY